MHSHMNSVIAKRVWNYLRISYFMMRKGLLSKRKFIMDINLMMKRGKLLRKTLGNLKFHHHHRSRNVTRGGFGLQEYEFSCNDSPNPVFFHVPKRKHHYFPCINPPTPNALEEYPKSVVILPKIDYSPESEYSYKFLSDKERFASSPFSVRISNYSSEDDENEDESKQVDDDAEAFIKRFYEQLRAQSHVQLLH
ncbi:hypothetical protein FRX31_015488 [Thalictrum thalictroides]|uniref:Avr9/Cf-9 rapidly elicited protein n=1 Tax=Thalictrum thalictroides TaxID=46969 RepID=A0A7J6WEU3_THATH|nr:hypothetical protein FRX31_015488 [Thalictrum thalictroides]